MGAFSAREIHGSREINVSRDQYVPSRNFKSVDSDGQ